MDLVERCARETQNHRMTFRAQGKTEKKSKIMCARARLCAIRTFAFSRRLLKHAIRHSGQFSFKPRLPDFHSDVADRGPEANPTVWPQPGARLQTRYVNLKAERSISLNIGESPIASIPPPRVPPLPFTSLPACNISP